jgi:hypothetical protein
MTLLVLCVAVTLGGGFHLTVAGGRLSVTSAARLLLWASLLAILRHVLVPRDPLVRRVVAVIWPAGLPWQVRLSVAVYVGSAVLLVAAMTDSFHPGVGWTELIGFGDQFDRQALPAVRHVPHYIHQNSAGYDGQFYAQLAIDPLLKDPASRVALDAPAFRARRILFSWTAYLLGFGKPSWILQAYAIQNIMCWLLLAWMCARWFPLGQLRSACGWFACLFTSGLILSVRFALTDGPSMLLIAAALVALERARPALAAGVLGLAGLGRETNVLAIGMLTLPALRPFSGAARLVVYGSVALLPLFLWLLYVHTVYRSYDPGIDALSVPLSAFVTAWRTTLAELGERGWWSPARYNFYTLLSLTVESAYLLWRRDWRNPWWRVGIAYAALMMVLGPAVWLGYPGAAPRVLLPLTFAFNVLIARDRWFWLLYVLGNLAVLHGLAVIDVLGLSRYL